MGVILCQFRAVLWKSLWIRRHHYIITAVILILPILFASILLLVKVHNSGSVIEGEKIYPPINKKDLLTQSFDYSKLNILYTPNNTATNSIMQTAYKKLNSQQIGHFKPINNETSMEEWFYNKTLKNESHLVEGYGIVFNNLDKENLKYTIRSTKFEVWAVNLKFPPNQLPGPMEAGHAYLSRGFLSIQTAIDEAFIEYTGSQSIDWNFQEFPYPAYERQDQFQLIYGFVFPLLLCYGYLYPILSIIKNIGEEKDSGLRERLRMGGIKSWILFAGWLIDSGIISSITSAILVLLLKLPLLTDTALLEKSNFVILWISITLYFFSGHFFAITVANMFTQPKYSTLIGVFLWTATYFLFTVLLGKAPSSITLFFISIIPNGYLLCSIAAIINFEVLGTGATFTNLFNYSGSEGTIPPLAAIWFASILGMVIFFGLTLYLDAVIVGKYGVAKPWYFIFPKRLNRLCRIMPQNNRTPMPEDEIDFIDEGTNNDKMKFEDALDSEKISIKIDNLYKIYGTIHALKNFSLKIYENQITALLGHNGAGKTTLLSIITGMVSPTQGEIITDNYQIFDNLQKFRNNLGYCPQENLLSPSLTVAQHLILFSLAKGCNRKKAIAKMEEIIPKCGLNTKNNTRVAELSGGMKRKLCLAISIVNDPQILILDEPTSGLDPESRRSIWNILLELRRDRTIILTTHFMEEADALGDKIAIMSHGELKCYGSSLFLKKNYGTGYIITILLSNLTEENFQDIKTIIQNETSKEVIINKTEENIITVQLSLDFVDNFPVLFEKLENANNVVSIAVSCTTIDDVFQKVNEEEGVQFSVDEVDMPIPYNQIQTTEQNNLKANSCKVYCRQLFALIAKKYHWICRNWIMTLLYILVPLIFIVITTYKNTTSDIENAMKPLLLDLNVYSKSQVILPNIDTKYSDSFKYQVTQQNSEILLTDPSVSVINELLKYAEMDEAKYRMSMIVAANMSTKTPTILYSSIGIHSPPIAINLLSNTLLNSNFKNSSKYRIMTYNSPYAFSSDLCSGGDTEISISFTVIFVLILTVIISYFMILVHIERITIFKELQFFTGLFYPIYWIYTFIIDFIIYIVIVITLILLMLIFNPSGMFRTWFAIGQLFVVLSLFGLSSIWCAYFYSFFFKTYNGATIFYTTLTTAICIIGFLVYSVFGYTYWRYIFYLNPLNPFAIAIYSIISQIQLEFRCKICKGPSIEMTCKAAELFGHNDYNLELYYLGFGWLFYFAIILFMDSGLLAYLWNICNKLIVGSIMNSRSSDEDVYREKERVEKINKEDDDRPVLIVDGLAKKYKRKLVAVKDVTFAVPKGQCFGLLGTNGAGKSTTFQMLTVYIQPTHGDAFANGLSVKKNRNRYMHQIGYCPQSDGLLKDLTGKETLTLFARLKGEYGEEKDHLVAKWIQLLDLSEYQNRCASTYSGGNLRKLSTAIALIGNPPVVFLDEPTTGVDPVTRRKIWHVLKKVQENNQTIIITSHSMDECEALCDRLTILVKGSMQCIGNIQYLKKVYGEGYTIMIKLGEISDDELNGLKEIINERFSNNCLLKDEQKGLLHYHLTDKTCLWSKLFKTMSDLKTEFPIIHDYVVTDTSLEQVFLSFAANT